MRYRAFLSYSHKDRKWASWLHRALESHRIPKTLLSRDGQPLPRRLAPIFRDRDELPSTASLSDAVIDALASSEKLVVICSPAAARSPWVNDEIRSFRRLGKSQHILCLIVDGEPGTGDVTECFPAALTESDDSIGPPLEPVAADARADGDGRKNALLKLIAGLLGVGFDALKQRDLRQRQRRMVAITAVSLTIAAVTIALSISATIARQDAEFRRTQAEDLVDFMLGDLTDRLREIERLDIYLSVGDKALEYFSAQRDADVSDNTLTQRAKNLRQIGEVRMDQGDLPAALEAFQESVIITDRLASHLPDNNEAQIGLANSHFYIGHVHFLRGELEEARARFEKVLPIVNRLSALEPDEATWVMEVGYANTNLGRVLELDGSLEAAFDAYQNVMTANQRLILLEPDNPDWDLEVGFAHNNIGNLVMRLGRLDEAESHYRADLDAKTRVLSSNPKHNQWRNYAGVSQYYLGQLLVYRGEYEEAGEKLRAAHDSFMFLLTVDPDRTNWQMRLANIERALGLYYFGVDQPAKGMEHLQSSVATLGKLVTSDKDNARLRQAFTRSLIVNAESEHRLGHFGPASDSLNSAVIQAEKLLKVDSANRETRQLSVYADVCNAIIAESLSAGSGLAASQSALDKLDRFFAESPDPHLLDLKARALTVAGRTNEASRIQAQLRAMGYNGRRF